MICGTPSPTDYSATMPWGSVVSSSCCVIVTSRPCLPTALRVWKSLPGVYRSTKPGRIRRPYSLWSTTALSCGPYFRGCNYPLCHLRGRTNELSHDTAVAALGHPASAGCPEPDRLRKCGLHPSPSRCRAGCPGHGRVVAAPHATRVGGAGQSCDCETAG